MDDQNGKKCTGGGSSLTKRFDLNRIDGGLVKNDVKLMVLCLVVCLGCDMGGRHVPYIIINVLGEKV